MRLYIAGPMSGHADHNVPAFREAEALLRDRGYDVSNPADHEGQASDWVGYMRLGITALLQALTIPTNEPDAATSATERGADPVAHIKSQLWVEAENRGWSVDELARAFSEWSGEDEDIREATVERLTDYYISLVPRRRMRRAGQTVAS